MQFEIAMEGFCRWLWGEDDRCPCTRPRRPNRAPVVPQATLEMADARSRHQPQSSPVPPRRAQPAATPQRSPTLPEGVLSSSSRKDPPLRLLGVGAGGVEELAQKINEEIVSWALLRFQYGTENNTRSKLLTVHCLGKTTKIMDRGWMNAQNDQVVALLGDTHQKRQVASAEELTMDFLVEAVRPLFNLQKTEASKQALRNYYESSVNTATMVDNVRGQRVFSAGKRNLASDFDAAAGATASSGAPRSSAADKASERQLSALMAQATEAQRHYRTASEDAANPQQPDMEELLHLVEEETEVTLEEAINEVSHDLGIYNWLLLEPERLELFRCGCGGLDEMKTYFDDDKVLFGLWRLSFSCGRAEGPFATMTKHVLVKWAGSDVNIVRRGKMVQKWNQAAALLKTRCSATLSKEVGNQSELLLDNVLEDIKKFAVKDRLSSSHISESSYKEALRHESEVREVRRRQKLQQAAALLAHNQEELQRLRSIEVERLEQLMTDSMANLQKMIKELDDKDAHQAALESSSGQSTEEGDRADSAAAAAQAPGAAERVDLRTAIEAVRSDTDPWNWVLCGWLPEDVPKKNQQLPFSTPLSPSRRRAAEE